MFHRFLSDSIYILKFKVDVIFLFICASIVGDKREILLRKEIAEMFIFKVINST